MRTTRPFLLLLVVVFTVMQPFGALKADTNPNYTCQSQPVGLLGYALSVDGSALAIDVQGDYAYVGDWGYRFQVFDVSNPCNPTRLYGDVETTQEIADLVVHGDYAYLANDRNGLVVYDISNPNLPSHVQSRNDGTYATTTVASMPT